MSTTPAAVAKRRQSVLRFLSEQGKPLASGKIRDTLRLSPHTTSTALRSLLDEGKVERVGEGAGSRYRATKGPKETLGSSSATTAQPIVDETMSRLMVSVIEDRGYASLEELHQATGFAAADILTGCGGLVHDGVLRMERRNGRGVYVVRRRS